MNTAYVKQHIVPKCYLDRFAEFNNGKYLIGTRYVDDNGVVKLFTEVTTKVGYVRNFYDVTDKEDEKHWEHYLANEIDHLFDIELGNIISSIHLSGEGFKLSDDDISALSKIVVSQTVRVPESVDYVLDNLYPKVAKNVKKEILDMLPDDIRNRDKPIIDSIEMTKQSQKESYFNYFFDEKNFKKLSDVVKSRVWVVYINAVSSSLPFITSDNPVLVESLDDINRVGVFRNGIASPNTCFFFPLTPSIAIANYSNMGRFNHIANDLNMRVFKLEDTEYINRRNQGVMKQAFRHSFIPQPLFDRLTKENLTA